MHKDFFDMLRRDHEAIRALLTRLAETPADAPDDRAALLGELRDAFVPHMRAEERVFYKALREQEGSSHEDALHSYEEHAEMQRLLGELRELPPTASVWGRTVRELGRLVRQHIEDEEEAVYEDARESFSDAEMRDLYTRFEEERARVRANLDASARDVASASAADV